MRLRLGRCRCRGHCGYNNFSLSEQMQYVWSLYRRNLDLLRDSRRTTSGWEYSDRIRIVISDKMSLEKMTHVARLECYLKMRRKTSYS